MVGWTNYQDYIASPEWREKRARLFKRGQIARCWCCNRKARVGKSLDAHHLTYEHFGDERPGELVLLCQMCHAMVHLKAVDLTASLSEATDFVRQIRRTRTMPAGWKSPVTRNVLGRRRS